MIVPPARVETRHGTIRVRDGIDATGTPYVEITLPPESRPAVIRLNAEEAGELVDAVIDVLFRVERARL